MAILWRQLRPKLKRTKRTIKVAGRKRTVWKGPRGGLWFKHFAPGGVTLAVNVRSTLTTRRKRRKGKR